MTGTPRLIAVLGAALAVLVGLTLTASATFAEKVSAAPVEISTATLAPVDNLEVKNVVCTETSVSALVEWRASTERNVSGYRVTAHMANGQTELIEQVGPRDVEAVFTRDRTWLQKRPSFTVTLLTSYGWTSQTARSSVLAC